MATGGSDVSSGSITNKRENLTCPLCLDIFCDPKLLPCTHTYCEKCLNDLLQKTQDQNTFPCPSCREELQVPPGGASALQANFNINAEDLERARDRTRCFLHPQKKFDMFCENCDSLICTDCKLSEHLHHASRKLVDAAKLASDQLTDDKARLEKAIADLEKNSTFRSTDQTEFKRKKEVVEQEIRQRHSTLMAAADVYRDKALAELEASFVKKAAASSEDLDGISKNLEELLKLSGKIDMAKQQEQECEIVLVAKDMRSGDGSPKAVKKLTSVPRLSQVNRPVHRSTMSKDAAMFGSMKEFIGKADYVNFDSLEAEMNISEHFRCKEDDDITVFCVCPNQNGTVCLSFESCDSLDTKNTPAATKYTQEGKMLNQITGSNGTEAVGRVSMNRNKDGGILYDDNVTRCSKNNFSVKPYISCPKGSGKTQVRAYSNRIAGDSFCIDCGPHRAFDVDSSETRFVVVTEPVKDGETREVRLYSHSGQYGLEKKHPPCVDTYCSPIKHFNPADVCFFSLRGKEMLLIADEHNDAIHVVDLHYERLSFSRFLCPGNPYLLQPTALNTDHEGRLWVANRGARMVVFQPLSAVDLDNSLKRKP